MNVNPVEIESIVRKVLSTLLAGDLAGSEPQSSSVVVSDELAIADNVVSASTLEGRLSGMKTLRLLKSAIITPAARDLCRQAKVTIVKGDRAATAASKPAMDATTTSATSKARPQRLIIAGSCHAMVAIEKQMCPKQANVRTQLHDDTAALREIANGLRNGHQAGVLIAASPHAACWQAARDEKLRPAVVSQWSDLPAVLSEVPVNVLILSASKWNVPSICNASRHLFEHLKRIL
ncbi:MAG: hypothetical protein LW870_13620 [Pirellula sp.]|jgi:hypothetical protein|nr:hypothetical protein [Pirellula sp.]